MPDSGDEARRLADQDLHRALTLGRRRPPRERLCVVCGRPIPADQLARDPDITGCGACSWGR